MPAPTNKWISTFLKENLNKFDDLDRDDINSRADLAIIIMDFILKNFHEITHFYLLTKVIFEKILELKNIDYEGCKYEKKEKLFQIMNNILILYEY